MMGFLFILNIKQGKPTYKLYSERLRGTTKRHSAMELIAHPTMWEGSRINMRDVGDSVINAFISLASDYY